MSLQSAPHPVHLHSNTPTSTSEATSSLTSFLQRASIDPSYRPDSTLSNRGDGPQSNSGGTGNINLTLYHLERILKGLNGEDLGIGKAEEILGQAEEAEGENKPSRRDNKSASKKTSNVLTRVPVIAIEGQPQARADGTEGSEWQDREAYEREQEVEQGEIGDRDMTVPDAELLEDVAVVGDEMDVDANADAEAGAAGAKRPLTAKEKEERKRRKKERRKEEKREKTG